MECWNVYGPPDECTLDGERVVCTWALAGIARLSSLYYNLIHGHGDFPYPG